MSERFDEPAHSQAQPSRRTVMRTAAWSIPAVAAVSAAPAFAASCVNRLYRVTDASFNGGTRTSQTAWSKPFTLTKVSGAGGASTSSVLLTSSATYPSGAGGDDDTYTTYQNAGALGSSMYGLSMTQVRTSNASNATQARARAATYSYTFAQSVKNVTFTVTDLDSNSGQYSDRLILTSGYTLGAVGSNVSTSTTGGVTTFAAGSNTLNDNNGNGNVTVTYPGPITNFSLTYWNSLTGNLSGDGRQGIYISKLSFEYEICS